MDDATANGRLQRSQVQDFGHTVIALRLVFWGSLLWLLDWNLVHVAYPGGWLFKHDVLKDAVGMPLIAVGVFLLWRAGRSAGCGALMAIVSIAAALALGLAARDHFMAPLERGEAVVTLVRKAAGIAAVVIFCIAMRRLSVSAGLAAAARGWMVTAILFAVVLPLPALWDAAGEVRFLATGKQYPALNLGLGGYLKLAMFVVPAVHFLFTISRTERGVVALDAAADARQGRS